MVTATTSGIDVDETMHSCVTVGGKWNMKDTELYDRAGCRSVWALIRVDSGSEGFLRDRSGRWSIRPNAKKDRIKNRCRRDIAVITTGEVSELIF